jgi:hypothetical protein
MLILRGFLEREFSSSGYETRFLNFFEGEIESNHIKTKTCQQRDEPNPETKHLCVFIKDNSIQSVSDYRIRWAACQALPGLGNWGGGRRRRRWQGLTVHLSVIAAR